MYSNWMTKRWAQSALFASAVGLAGSTAQAPTCSTTITSPDSTRSARPVGYPFPRPTPPFVGTPTLPTSPDAHELLYQHHRFTSATTCCHCCRQPDFFSRLWTLFRHAEGCRMRPIPSSSICQQYVPLENGIIPGRRPYLCPSRNAPKK